MNRGLTAVMIICLVVASGLFKQSMGQTQTKVVTDTIQDKATSLDLGQIPDFGNKTRSLISDIQQVISNNEIITEISFEIVDVLKTLDDNLLIVSDTVNTWKLNELEKKERDLVPLNERITKWRRIIDGVSDNCRAKDSLINSMAAVWQLTLDSMTSSHSEPSFASSTDNTSASTDLKSEVEKFIAELNTSKINLQNYIDTIRTVQTEIAYAENELGNISSIIESKKDILNKNIWIPDSPPIWQIKRDTTGLNIASSFKSVIHSNLDIIKAFFKSNSKMPYYAVLLFVLIFGIILYLRTNSKILYADFQEEPKDVNFVLRNPFLTSLIILWFGSLFLSIFPKELNDLISLAMIGPLALVLYKLNDHWKWPSAAIFSFTYLLFLIVRDIDFTFLSQRLFLIGINGFCLFMFWRFKKRESGAKHIYKLWLGTFSFFIQFFIIAGIVSLLASFYGSTRLAQLISFVSLGMIICIYALQAAVLLTRNLVFLILMGPFAKHSNILKDDHEMVLNKMDQAFRFIGFISFIAIFLNLSGIVAETIETAKSIINYELMVGEMSISLGNFIAFLLTLQISIWLSSLIRYVLDKEVYPRSHFKPGVPNTISLMIKFTFALLGILLAFSAAGLQLDKLTILMGALGVGIGFGLQGIIANFVSGIILALERPITIGDIIDIPGASGYVYDIGLRASTIHTWEGSHAVVPNSDLISNKLTNWTFPNDRKRRIKVEVRVPFDTDMEALSTLLLEIAGTIPEVMKKPKPYLNFKGIGSSAMEMDLYCWTDDSDKIFTYGTAIRKAVYKALRDAGYDIPVPVQDVKIDDEKSVKTIKSDSKK